MTDVANLLATDNLTELMSNFDSNTINKSERKKSGKGAVRAKKDLPYLFRMKIWMIYFKIIKIIKSSH